MFDYDQEKIQLEQGNIPLTVKKRSMTTTATQSLNIHNVDQNDLALRHLNSASESMQL